jgi:hypothetical protein
MEGWKLACPVCETEFVTKDRRKKYCCYECNNAAQRKRQKEYRKNHPEKAEQKKEQYREAAKRRRQARKESGMCVRCGKKPVYRDLATCFECAQYFAEKSLKKYYENKAKRNAAGMCVICGERPPVEGTERCQMCLDKTHEYWATKYGKGEYNVTNICKNCGAEFKKNRHFYNFCSRECRDEYRVKYNRERNKIKYHELKEQGLCVSCGRTPAADGIIRCAECEEKLKSYKRNGKEK